MFIHELNDDIIIEMSKQYCQESSNKEIGENALKSELLQVNRLNDSILVFFYGQGKSKSIDVVLNDFNVNIFMEGGIEDSTSTINSHIKNMLSNFGMEYYTMLEHAIRLGEVDINLQTLYSINKEIQEENPEM